MGRLTLRQCVSLVVLTAAVKMPVLLDTGTGDTTQLQDED